MAEVYTATIQTRRTGVQEREVDASGEFPALLWSGREVAATKSMRRGVERDVPDLLQG